ncbi:MAG: hypothetical protein H6936_09315 [Burkholderiales bacterium]|nr:hypothetical protein [Nitrosomonas sp.]MCP5275031.1 hypothetical protein [Burkholderiales bacterium]
MKIYLFANVLLFIVAVIVTLVGKKIGISIKKYVVICKSIGLVAFFGIVLSIFSIWFDFTANERNSKEQKQLIANQEILQSEVKNIPENIVAKISEVLELDAQLTEEGPLKDLARLTKSAEPLKIAARKKIESGDRRLETEGAEDLLKIAKDRSKLIELINKQAAEDFREAGAAFLVAGDIERALQAYQSSTLLDPTNMSGFLTLSELALQAGDVETAEHAALECVKLVDGGETSNFAKYFAYSQISKIYISSGSFKKAKLYLDLLLSERSQQYQSNREFSEKNPIEKFKISKPPTIMGNDKTHVSIFWGGEIQLIYKFGNLGGEDMEEQIGSIVTDSMTFITRHQLMKAYELSGKYYAALGNSTSAKNTFKKAIALSNIQNQSSGQLGLQNYTLSLYDQLLRSIDADNDIEKIEIKLEMLALEEQVLTEVEEVISIAEQKGIKLNYVELVTGSRIDRKKELSTFAPVLYDLLRNIAQRNLELALIYFEKKEYANARKFATLSTDSLKKISSEKIKLEEEMYLKIALFYNSLFHMIDGEPKRSCEIMDESDALLKDRKDILPDHLTGDVINQVFSETQMHISYCKNTLKYKH